MKQKPHLHHDHDDGDDDDVRVLHLRRGSIRTHHRDDGDGGVRIPRPRRGDDGGGTHIQGHHTLLPLQPLR